MGRDNSVFLACVHTIFARTSSPPMAPTSIPPDDVPGFLWDLAAATAAIGFSRHGVASLDPDRRDPRPHERFRQWLAEGRAGPMADWLSRHEPFRRDPRVHLPGARSVIMLATDHASGPFQADEPCPPGRGRVARYAWGDDYHDLLRERVNRLGSWLETRLPGCSSRGFCDSVPFPEREYAWLAGLGWFGKNTMLIDPEAGSYFLLTVLLTDALLPTSEPVLVDHCGSCTACLDACPTQAFIEPRLLDATRCISSLTIEQKGPVDPGLRAAIGDRAFGCDICQEVCPWNRRAPGSTEPGFQPRAGEATLPLADVLNLGEEELRARFRGTPLLRAKRSGLLRSAAIVLGNHPDPASSGSLIAALDDPDAGIRSAAAWALGEWRRAPEPLASRALTVLVARLDLETDAAVREELAAAIYSHSAVSSTSAEASRPGPSVR